MGIYGNLALPPLTELRDLCIIASRNAGDVIQDVSSVTREEAGQPTAIRTVCFQDLCNSSQFRVFGQLLNHETYQLGMSAYRSGTWLLLMLHKSEVWKKYGWREC